MLDKKTYEDIMNYLIKGKPATSLLIYLFSWVQETLWQPNKHGAKKKHRGQEAEYKREKRSPSVGYSPGESI